MRVLLSKCMILAVSALAVSGIAAATASAAEEALWIYNGGPVQKSVPVTDTGTVSLTVKDAIFGVGEVVSCKVSGKGTVAPQGAGTITAWNLTGCHQNEAAAKCQEGSPLVASALDLPWSSQLHGGAGIPPEAVNTIFSPTTHQVGLTYQCNWNLGLHKVTCTATSDENRVKNSEGGTVAETWQTVLLWNCEVVNGTGTIIHTTAKVGAGITIKPETGTLSIS
jgi:hypothetical protein